MRWLPSLLAVIAVSHGQYGLSEDTTTAPDRPTFDCAGQDDGNYAAVECSSEYFSCSSGIPYRIACPDNLTFDSKKNKCVYPNECGVEEIASTTTEAVSTTTQGATTTSTETVPSYVSNVDCSRMVNGYISEGCTPTYTICSYGVPTHVECDPGTLFDTMTGYCERAHECGKIRTTIPPATSPVPSAYPIPTTTNANDSPFDCQNKTDGLYSLGCNNEYVDCVHGTAMTRRCPGNLVFNEFIMRCDYQCVAPTTTTTQPQDVTTTTSVYPTYSTGLPSSTTSTAVPTTTEASSTTTNAPTVPSTTAAPSVCQSGQVASLGDCSSKFRRCKCGQWQSAVCPGSSVFDQLTGLCLYSVPRCYTDIVPGQQVTVPTDNVYATPTQGYYPDVNQNVAEAQTYMPMWDSEQLLSNPFYTRTRHRSHRKGGRRSDSGRQYKGKIHTKPKSVRVDDHSSYVTDNFRGSYEPYVHSSSWSTFPRSRVHRMRMHTAMRSQPDDDETELLDPEVEVTETKDDEKVTLSLASAVVPEFEGSGEMLMPEKENTASRAKRSYGFAPPGSASNDANSFCRGVATNSLVSLGSCRQEFVVCRSYLASVAACPVGDLFDDSKNACVPADICGVPGADVCAVPLSPVYPGTALEQTETTTSIPRIPNVRYCSQGISGAVVSTGCSRSYVICDNGIELSMNCQEGLVYNKAKSECDYRDRVVECGGVDDSKVASTPIPMDVVTTTGTVPENLSPTNAPSGDICSSVGSGYVPASHCSSTYYFCEGGKIRETQNCPAKLIYDVENNLCDFPSAVPGCAGIVVDSIGSNDVTNREQATPSVDPTAIATSKPATIGYGVTDAEVSTVGREEPNGLYVIHTTTSKPIIGDCDGAPNGFIPAGSCSGSFLNCQDGKVLATMSCGSVLVYDGDKGQCVHRHELASCSGSSGSIVVPTDNSPAEQQSVYTTSAPNYSSPAAIVAPYEVPVERAGCEAAVKAEGKCSPKYFECKNGDYFTKICVEPLVFSDVSQTCQHKELVADCDESTTVATTIAVKSVTEALQENTTPTITSVPESSSVTMPYGQPGHKQCSYIDGLNVHSLAFCSGQYLECMPEGVLETVTCDLGQLFDSASLKCVPSSECGRPKPVEPSTTTTTAAPIDGRCVSLPGRSGVAAINNCSSQYLRCTDGVSVTVECPFKLVFSPFKGICMRRNNVHECRSNNIVYVSVSMEHKNFCVGRENRLYRDPKNCAGIIHCHGGEMFTRVGCSSGLVFNEQKQSCDYRQNVNGCEEKLQKPQKDTGCNGAEHGGYLPDDADCTIFYRCVWNRLERMHCPTGTFFNPTLSVCDWPSAVPHCSTKKQHSSTTTHTELSRPY